MIPQTLDERWKAYLDAEADDDICPSLSTRLGISACSAPRRISSAGQNPFESKKAGYSPLTALARQIKEHNRRWDMKAVRDRSQKLAKEALEGIWAWANV